MAPVKSTYSDLTLRALMRLGQQSEAKVECSTVRWKLLNFSNTHHHENNLAGVDHRQLQHRGSLTSLFPLLIFSCQTPLFTHLSSSSTFCPINAQPLNQQAVYEKISSHSLGIPGISYEMDWIRRDCLLNQNLHCNTQNMQWTIVGVHNTLQSERRSAWRNTL